MIRQGINRIRKAAIAFLPYSPMRGGREILDRQYGAGDWDYLWSADEAPRFGVVAAYCRLFADGGDVIEIGCGEGMLLQHLDRAHIRHFTGIDISSVAIERASRFADARTRFLVAEAETAAFDERFDVVVFNEVMEYFRDPLAVVRRWQAMLKPGGHLIVSIFDGLETARARHIWRALDGAFDVRARVSLSTEADYLWNIKVLAARDAPPP